MTVGGKIAPQTNNIVHKKRESCVFISFFGHTPVVENLFPVDVFIKMIFSKVQKIRKMKHFLDLSVNMSIICIDGCSFLAYSPLLFHNDVRK